MAYLTKDILTGFSEYKYSARDTSPLSIYVMHPFWNRIVEYFPRWIAPNVMTFAGFILSVLNFIIISYYDWDFYAQTHDEPQKNVPRWVWLLMAVNIFLAYTFDGIDGKQARRINLSGPLGEFFDHALDSYTASLIPVCLYSVFGRGNNYCVEPMRYYFVVLNVMLNFHISHWEKYNTGILYLPWGYDLGMWGSTLMYLATYFIGPDLWKYSLHSSGLKCGHLLEYVLHISALSNIPMVFYNLYRSYADKTGKMRSFTECIRPLISPAIFLLIMLTWLRFSPTNIINNHPRAIYLLTGTILSNISCRLIVSQMSNTRCEAINWMLPLLAAVFSVSYYIPRLEKILLYLMLSYSTYTHWEYGKSVIQQLCVHFDRVCFGVTKRSDGDKKD